MEAVHVRITANPSFDEISEMLILLIVTLLTIILRIYRLYRILCTMRRYYQALVDYLEEEQDAQEEAQDIEQERIEREHPNEVVPWSGAYRMSLFTDNFDPVRPQALGDGTPEFYIWREYKRNLRQRQFEREVRQRERNARRMLREGLQRA